MKLCVPQRFDRVICRCLRRSRGSRSCGRPSTTRSSLSLMLFTRRCVQKQASKLTNTHKNVHKYAKTQTQTHHLSFCTRTWPQSAHEIFTSSAKHIHCITSPLFAKQSKVTSAPGRFGLVSCHVEIDGFALSSRLCGLSRHPDVQHPPLGLAFTPRFLVLTNLSYFCSGPKPSRPHAIHQTPDAHRSLTLNPPTRTGPCQH
jgi:hypothetical protein